MNRVNIFLIVLALFLGLTGGYLLQNSQKNNLEESNTVPTKASQATKNNCLADECLLGGVGYPVSKLSAGIKDSLNQALMDEYKAYATYKATLDTFGNIKPFIMIARAEQQHISSLEGLFEKYGLKIPDNNLLNTISSPVSIEKACGIGVQAEIENVKLYKDLLLPAVKDYEDITIVFTSLMNASEQKHLPAFQRCD